MNIFAVSGLINAVTVSILGAIVYLKNKTKEINLRYAQFCFFVAFWSLCYCLWQNAQEKSAALFWSRGLMAGAIFIPISFLHFVLLLLDLYKKKRRIIVFGYIVFGLFLLTDFTPWFVQDVSPKIFFKFWPDAGKAFGVFLIIWLWYCLYACYLLIKYYTKFTGAKQQQIKYVLMGILIGYVSGSTNYFLWYNIPVAPYGNFIVPLFVGIMAYAVVRYRLMDINVVLTRAGVFLFVYLFVLGIPFWLGYTTKLWFPSTILAVSLATLGPFIYQSLRRRAEDIILRDQRHYQRALRELSATMTRIRDLPQLTETIASTVVNTVRAAFCAFYLKDDTYKVFVFKNCHPLSARSRFQDSVPLESNIIKLLEGQRKPLLGEEIGEQKEINLDSGMVIPVSMEDELFGFMVLGSKPNNQMYTPDDVLVFETLSYSTSLAIENCIFWKEIEDRHRKARLQEMDTYSYSLAHEIDNPMQVVLGHAELLKKDLVESIPDGSKHPGIIESFDFIIEAAKRVSGMVKAIRDFGQKTTGELKPLKVADVVESFSRLYYPQFKDKTVVFEQSTGLKEPVYIRGEKPELMQVLVILANNSVHALTGVKQKKACLKTELVNHEWVRISFGDNGYGIKKEMLEIIFTPFTTTKASTEGTGMGLYNAKKIIERHKGKIWAESEGPGKGAVFVIELPIAKDVNPQDLEDQYKGKRVF